MVSEPSIDLSIVIPSFRGVDRLRHVLPRVVMELERVPRRCPEPDAGTPVDAGRRPAPSDPKPLRRVEILVVDDGSPAEEQTRLKALIACSGQVDRRPMNGEGIVAGIPRGVVSGGSFPTSSTVPTAARRRSVASPGSTTDAPVVEVLAVCLPHNLGQQEATIVGCALARGDLVATMDDDGAHPVQDLAVMVERMRNDASVDVIYGAPFAGTPRPPLVRRVGTRLNNLLFTYFAGKPRHVPVTSFRVIRRDPLRRALHVPVSFPYLSAMLFASTPSPRVVVHRYLPHTGVAGRGAGGHGETDCGVAGSRRAAGTHADGGLPSGAPATGGRRTGDRVSRSRYTLWRLIRVFWHLVLYWGPLRPVGRRLRSQRVYDVVGGCR